MSEKDFFSAQLPIKKETPQIKEREAFFNTKEKFNIEYIHGRTTDEELNVQVKKIINELWSNNFSLTERVEYFADETFVYAGFERYEKMLLEKLNFDDENAYVETIKTLEFIRDLICSYEFEFISQKDFNEKTAKIKKVLDGVVVNKKGSYFLNLFADGLKKIIENRKPHDESLRIYNKKYQARMENKYGMEWEDYVDEENRLNHINEAKQYYLDKSHLPFMIAPKIYAVRAEGGFLVSQKENYEKIKTLMYKFKDLPKSNAEIFEMEGGVGYDKYIDQEQEVNNLYNEKIDRRTMDLVDKINFYLKNKLILEDLEINRKDKNKEDGERNTQNFHDFMYLQEPFFRELIKKSLNIDLSNISLNEQFYLLQFIKKIREKDIDLVKKFVQTNKADGLKAFLSLEFDKNNGDKLIMIGNSLEQKNAKKVFTKIAELTDLAQEKNKELAEIIFKDNTQKELPTNLSTELLRKAHAIILQFSAELEIDNQASEEKIQKLLADLEKSRIDIEIIAALLVATKKELATQNISEIKGVELEVVDGKKLVENEPLAEKLTAMYRANNSHKSEKDLERLLGDFEKHKQYKPKFNLIYFDRENKTNPEKSLDNLVGFMRSSSFDGQKELLEGERYFGAMNIDPILQKFYFGENFLREAMEKEFASGTKKLIAHVPENGPSHKITKLLGFETVAEEGDYRDDAGNIIAKRLRVELVRK